MACMRDGFTPGQHLDNGRFITLSPLNHGSFGMVLAAHDTLKNEDVAIKCITKPGASTDAINCPAAFAIDDRSEELEIHSRLARHPNIVNLIHHFETDNHQYMVLELCSNGDVYEAIQSGKGPLETSHVRDFMLQLVGAVDYLHTNGVFHRDIKPENIFLTASGSMKLGDFGLATAETWSTEFAVGSDRYMAPEQFESSVYGYGYSPAAADVWAIGIVLLNVLFQRNPFTSPTPEDLLFADFARDRQSLFDVFPQMSQDTYDVLVHSLALDPANRSLAAVREALNAVVSFTVDEETLDDFCTETLDEIPMATAAREPLRTPSITSPTLNCDGSFPWKNVLTTSPKTTRQLSTIRDEEDLFPDNSGWQYVDADEASLSSNVDSGLGMSYKSTKSMKSMHSMKSAAPAAASKPVAGFVGSLPISFTRPTSKSHPYSAAGFSKSWSDLWDEEEEMQGSVPLADDLASSADDVPTVVPNTPRLQSIREDNVRDSVTPQQDAPTLSAAIEIPVPTVSDAAELSKTRSSSILDKWAALGNFRRARPEMPQTATPVPAKTKYSEAFASFTTFGSGKKPKTPSKPRDVEAPRRQGSPQRLRASSFNNSRIWKEDSNWREHKAVPVSASSPSKTHYPPLPPMPPAWQLSGGQQSHLHQYQQRPNTAKASLERMKGRDFEWAGDVVSGWRDFHL